MLNLLENVINIINQYYMHIWQSMFAICVYDSIYAVWMYLIITILGNLNCDVRQTWSSQDNTVYCTWPFSLSVKLYIIPKHIMHCEWKTLF
jgi:hypothetical protein